MRSGAMNVPYIITLKFSLKGGTELNNYASKKYFNSSANKNNNFPC